ncbi:hypothetical protein OG21DRAFT_1509449 [Imleria badia]|nr:hypothetical protein OG21DRAFT_1509449 [Imleria badia]
MKLDTEQFIPERFLGAEGMLIDDTPDFAFGFGRRVCPGRYTAEASMWSAFATMLATLDFNLAKDAGGKDIEFEVKYMNGMARHTLTFPCHINPRAHISKAALERVLAK